MEMPEQLDKKTALGLAESEVWKNWTDKERVEFQLYQNLLCMPFDTFHKSVEKTLDRPVFTHEFAFPDHLKQEFEGKCGKPSFENIIDLLPKDKEVVVIAINPE